MLTVAEPRETHAQPPAEVPVSPSTNPIRLPARAGALKQSSTARHRNVNEFII
jgi:hypothetical protein